MALVTNSRVPKRASPLHSLVHPLAHASFLGPVPLLVFRLPQFERIAWREGRRAAQRVERATTASFIQACRKTLRIGDRIGHDRQSDVFVIAMMGLSRESRLPSPADCRSVLERVAAAMSLTSDMRVETGWTFVRDFNLASGLSREIETALERGVRERERYEFFATIGHELRTPLTSIRGYLETLIAGELDAATSRRFLKTAQREAVRMGRLLDGMFEFSLLDLSVHTLETRSCRIIEQIELACDVVRPLAHQRQIVIERSNCEDVFALVDPDACLQLLINLLDNAIKYGRKGGVVVVSARARDEGVVLCVDDDGPGIARVERDAIFGLRVRGARSTTGPGAGIGLAIVKMIAERAGGSIAVANSPLGGARFEATFMLRAESTERAS